MGRKCVSPKHTWDGRIIKIGTSGKYEHHHGHLGSMKSWEFHN
jgi:hypothetical protein